MKTYEIHDAALGMILSQHARYWPVAKAAGFCPEIFEEVERMKIAAAIEKISNQDGATFSHRLVIDALAGDGAGLIGAFIRHAPIEQNLTYFISQLVMLRNIRRLELDVIHLLSAMKDCRPSLSMAHVVTMAAEIADKAKGFSPSSSFTRDFLSEVLPSAHERNLEIINLKNAGITPGLSTGYPQLDLALGSGMRRGGLYVIAARTSVGKTTFATSIFGNAMNLGLHAGYFINEMDDTDIANKLISREGRLHGTKLISGDWDSPEDQRAYYTGFELLESAPGSGWLDEKSGQYLDQLLSVVHQKAYEKKCDVIVVDYIQQVRVRGSRTQQEQVSRVSDELKKLARDLKIVVIGLAQLNRDAEDSTEAELGLRHIRDSGSIEQDADAVIMLYKNSIKDEDMVAKVLKSRHGKVGDVKMRHFMPFNFYQEL